MSEGELEPVAMEGGEPGEEAAAEGDFVVAPVGEFEEGAPDEDGALAADDAEAAAAEEEAPGEPEDPAGDEAGEEAAAEPEEAVLDDGEGGAEPVEAALDAEEGAEAAEEGEAVPADAEGCEAAGAEGAEGYGGAIEEGAEMEGAEMEGAEAALEAAEGEEVEGVEQYGETEMASAAENAEPQAAEFEYGMAPESDYGAAADVVPAWQGEDAVDAGAYGGAALLTSYGDEVAEERLRHEAAMRVETRAREELEDMILRIEKHFKAEQAARKKAEELLQVAIAGEVDAMAKLEEMVRRRAAEGAALDEERVAVRKERDALEGMRQEFDSELEAARMEVAKAQEALSGSEERIKATEAADRMRLEMEHQRQAAAMGAELERLREEMAYRMVVMQEEVAKWRMQATSVAEAVMETKDAVQARKRELESTKDKLDGMLDKLLAGRERGLELGGISAAQRMMMVPPGGMGGMHQQHMHQMQQMGGGMHGHGPSPLLMPPVGKAAASAHGGWMIGAGGAPSPTAGSDSPTQRMKLPPIENGAAYITAEGHRSDGGYNSYGEESDGEGVRKSDAYSHVKSRYSAKAAEVTMTGKGARAKSGRTARAKPSKPDRFAEAEREAGQGGHAGSKWN